MGNAEERDEHKGTGANRDPHVAGHFCATDQRIGGVDASRVVATTVDCREMHRESLTADDDRMVCFSSDLVRGTTGALCREVI